MVAFEVSSAEMILKSVRRKADTSIMHYALCVFADRQHLGFEGLYAHVYLDDIADLHVV